MYMYTANFVTIQELLSCLTETVLTLLVLILLTDYTPDIKTP